VEESGEIGFLEITECVPNSQCGADGLCVCDIKYHEIFNGTCAISKLFDESCSDEDKCSQFEKLHCLNGTCGCKEDISIYSIEKNQCVGVLNQNCIDGKCFKGAECKEGKCLCDIDHYEDSSSKNCLLRKGFNEQCNSDSECVHKGLLMLKCLNGMCNCDEGFKYSKVEKMKYSVRPNYYQYEQATYLSEVMDGVPREVCAPLVGRKCSDGYCVPNSKCVFRSGGLSQDIYSYMDKHYRNPGVTTVPYYMSISLADFDIYNDTVCKCTDSSYIPNGENSKCGRRREEGCQTNDDCLNNLICDSQRCMCPSPLHQKINTNRDECISKIWAFCTKDTNCVDNSFCKLLANSTVGDCQCKEGYVDNADGECEVSHGSPCLYRNECDKAADLVCKNKICSCRDDFMYKYSPTARKCLGVVGSICNTSEIPCVDNASCSVINKKLQSRCTCKKGYKKNVNFTCDEMPNEEL